MGCDNIDFTCVHAVNDVTTTSTIDHFIYNDAGEDFIEDAELLV